MGYQTDTLEQNKFVIKAIQFEDVTSGKVEVNKVFTGFKDVAGEVDYSDEDNFDAFTLTAPRLLVQSKTGYDTYYYVKNAWIADGPESYSYQEGWANTWGGYVSDSIPAGRGFWLKAAADVKVTFGL